MKKIIKSISSFFFTAILTLCFSAVSVYAQFQSRKIIKIPDIPGFLTLKCDLHMHTVFSDGEVMPQVRVKEAWLEGLDVIAITDHIEYCPHKQDIPIIDFNRSYELALQEANASNILLIHAAEITRSYPLGHYNCYFLKDANKLKKDDFYESIQEASNQGAYIVWNHPGWLQKDEIPIWYDVQTKLYNQKIFRGIEIVNEYSYYPLSYQWAIDKQLTITGNTDVHAPVALKWDIFNGKHRPMTIIFAKEKTENAVREALEEYRTAVYYADTLFGGQQFLKPIFDNSVKILNPEVRLTNNSNVTILIRNSSDIPYQLKYGKTITDEFKPEQGLTLYPDRISTLNIDFKKTDNLKNSKIILPYHVQNMQVAPGKALTVEFEIEIK